MKKVLASILALSFLAFLVVPVSAESVEVDLEPSTYTLGSINPQDGRMKTGSFDVMVSGSYS